MTPKQQRFVEEYLIDLNATQAAIRAGYSKKTAVKIGTQVLGKTSVQKAIERALARRSARTEVTQDRIIKELARIAFIDPRKIFEWGPSGVTLRESEELTDDDAAAVSEISQISTEFGRNIKAKLHDKIKALDLLMKHMGMQEITDKDPLVIMLQEAKDAQPDPSSKAT